MMTRESDCFAIECVLGNIFWFADKERFWQSGNHKEQRTGFKTVFFLVFPTRGEFFYSTVEKRGRERGKTAKRKVPQYTTHTNVDNRPTHTRSARARKRRRRKVLRLTRTDRGRGSSSSEKQEHTHAHT